MPLDQALHLTPRRDLPTLGPSVTEFMAEIGSPLVGWQSEFLDLAMEREGDLPARSTVGLLAPRQNGKTVLALARLLYGLVVLRERRVVYSAHSYDTAREILNVLEQMIDKAPRWLRNQIIASPRTYGQEGLIFRSGSRLFIRTRTRSGARGLAGDIVMLDEALELRDRDFMRALLPVVTARPQHQVWYLSSAGDPGSLELLDLQERARNAAANGDDSLAYAEFAAPRDYAVDDVEGWKKANPSMGLFISERTLREQLLRLGEDRFSIEHLGHWHGAALNTVVDPGDWQRAIDTDLIVPANSKCWLGMDLSPSGSDATLVALHRVGDRHALERAQSWVEPDPDRMVSDIVRHYGALNAVGVAYPPWTAKLIAERLEARDVPVEPVSGQRFAAACQEFASRVKSGALVHPGDDVITAHVRGAVRKDSGDSSWSVARRKSSGSITGLVASINALGYAVGSRQPEEIPTWSAY